MVVKKSILQDKIKNAKAWLWEQQETLTSMEQTGRQIVAAMNKRRTDLQNDRIALAKLVNKEKRDTKVDKVKKE